MRRPFSCPAFLAFFQGSGKIRTDDMEYKRQGGVTVDSKRTGAFIAQCRKEKGMTQRELAEALGVTNKAVSKWETGGGMPDVSLLAPLSRVLGVSVDEIMNGEKQKYLSVNNIGYKDNKKASKKTKKRIQITKRLIGSVLCFLAAFLGIAMQIVYGTIGKPYRLEYMSSWMWYVVNAVCLLFLWGGIFLLLKNRKTIIKIVTGVLGVLFLVNGAAAVIQTRGMQDIISISPDHHTVMVLRQDRENGKVVTYRPAILWFVRESDPFPYTADEEMKIQWLEQDACAVTYTSPDDGNVHQYVMTYGVRDSGITSPPVYSVLSGVWEAEGQNTAGWSLETDVSGVHLKNGSEEMLYTYDDCVQFGTIAMVLCRNGLPQWTVVLNQDCIIDEASDLVTEGTISVCKVSMEKTAPVILSGGSPDYSEMFSAAPTQEEMGEQLVEKMKKTIKDTNNLATFESEMNLVKVETESADPFEIGKRALELDMEFYAANGCNSDVQITSMKLLAGDSYDFLLEINTTEEIADIRTPEDVTTAELQYKYRVMKAEDAYLAARVSYGTDGTVGLEAPGVEQKLDTADNPEYHFFREGKPLGE